MDKKELLKMVTLVAGAVVALGGAVTWGVNAWTEWGWVTKQTYLAESSMLVRRLEFDEHVLAQGDLNVASEKTQSEILAYVRYVPQLEGLLRNRCMGGRVPQSIIDDLVERIETLLEDDYEQPACTVLLAQVP